MKKELFKNLTVEEIEWLAMGNRGISSEAIFARITGIPLYERKDGYSLSDKTYHPLDVSDFCRCEKLLLKCPHIREQFHLCADLSPVWAELVKAWEEIRKSLEQEIPDWLSPDTKGKAPETYLLIKKAIKSAAKKD